MPPIPLTQLEDILTRMLLDRTVMADMFEDMSYASPEVAERARIGVAAIRASTAELLAYLSTPPGPPHP